MTHQHNHNDKHEEHDHDHDHSHDDHQLMQKYNIQHPTVQIETGTNSCEFKTC